MNKAPEQADSVATAALGIADVLDARVGRIARGLWTIVDAAAEKPSPKDFMSQQGIKAMQGTNPGQGGKRLMKDTGADIPTGGDAAIDMTPVEGSAELPTLSPRGMAAMQGLQKSDGNQQAHWCLEKPVQEEQARALLDAAESCTNTPQDRDRLLSKAMDYLDHGMDPKELTDNAELLGSLDSHDPQVLNSAKLCELQQHFGREGDVFGLLDVSEPLGQSPSERSAFVNLWLDQLDRTKDIPGIETVLADLNQDPGNPKQYGAQFELNWLSRHADGVTEIGVPAISRQKGRVTEGIDVMMDDGSAVELKSYSEDSIHANVTGLRHQANLDLNDRGAKSVRFVFDGSQLPSPLSQRTIQVLDSLAREYRGRVSFEVDDQRRVVG